MLCVSMADVRAWYCIGFPVSMSPDLLSVDTWQASGPRHGGGPCSCSNSPSIKCVHPHSLSPVNPLHLSLFATSKFNIWFRLQGKGWSYWKKSDILELDIFFQKSLSDTFSLKHQWINKLLPFSVYKYCKVSEDTKYKYSILVSADWIWNLQKAS